MSEKGPEQMGNRLRHVSKVLGTLRVQKRESSRSVQGTVIVFREVTYECAYPVPVGGGGGGGAGGGGLTLYPKEGKPAKTSKHVFNFCWESLRAS